MEEKRGLFKLGYVGNSRPNQDGVTCFTLLGNLMGKQVSKNDIDEFVESDDCIIEYLGSNGEIVDRDKAYKLRFKLPNKSINGETVYGCFSRQTLDGNFAGISWVFENGDLAKYVDLSKIGIIHPNSIEDFKTCHEANFENINEIVQPNVEYYNGKGFTKFQDGTTVSYEKAKFIMFETKCH